MYHDLFHCDVVAGEEVPSDIPARDAALVRLTCRETNNVLWGSIQSTTAAQAEGIHQQIINEQPVDFMVDFIRFDYRGSSGSVLYREIERTWLPARFQCREHDNQYAWRASIDHHALSTFVVSAMWAANSHDFRLIEFLSILDPWGLHDASRKVLSEWAEGIEVVEARLSQPRRYDWKPMTADNFDKASLLVRMRDPMAPVYYSELLAWVCCKEDTLIKYLKGSGLARRNAQMKGWSCRSADIVERFVPYIETLPKCFQNFFRIPDDLREAGLLPGHILPREQK